MGIGKVTAKTKDSPRLRSQLRQYLEPRTSGILEAINQQVLERAKEQLKLQGYQGLVVIIDNLDRVDISPKASGRSQPEYLFIDRGEQLKKLNCHLVYTIPLVLIFSNELSTLTNRFGIKPVLLPMVTVKNREKTYNLEGIKLLRQMVLARAFPWLGEIERLSRINEVFDSDETLDRLCRVSGGHVRNLLVLLYSCLQEDDPLLGGTVWKWSSVSIGMIWCQQLVITSGHYCYKFCNRGIMSKERTNTKLFYEVCFYLNTEMLTDAGLILTRQSQNPRNLSYE